MSDSDEDLLTNDVLTFQSQGTTISARGPNINNTNISSLSFRKNMNMPWNRDRPRYAESVCDQRSLYYRRERETSPMSFHSASGMPPKNLHQSYYPGAMSSHRSVYNGRSGSSMSIRTVDSNTSMTANDIAFAFQNGTFNKFDFKMIKDAYNKFIRSRTRKRIEKRRNVRMFSKGFHRKSGDDSGDQASNSSISSDDCTSIRTSKSTIYRTTMSSCRSTKTDILDFRRTIKHSNVLRDSTEHVRQPSFKSMLSHGCPREKELDEKWQNESMIIRGENSQKERFKNGILLPSQRFGQSVSSFTENPYRLQRINEGNTLNCAPTQIEKPNGQSKDTESEQEEIFADVTVRERNSTNNGATKRIHEQDEIDKREKKRIKISPIKNILNTPKQNKQLNTSAKQKRNEFVFAKPQLPIKKQTISKQKQISSHKPKEMPPSQEKHLNVENTLSQSVTQPVEQVISGSQKAVEKLISKSTLPLVPSTEYIPPLIHEEEMPISSATTQHLTTDMSMRPSFIKRKLFTQKVDVAEKNSSSDSIQAETPQTDVYSKIQKEKNRARKLVTSQSCLNRDVQDDSNLLDLIHKIVPAERMNVTNATNRAEIQNNKSKQTHSEKWDVTSMITTCNNSDDISETFTDDDIIFPEDSKKQQKNQTKFQKSDEKSKDVVIIEETRNKPLDSKKKIIREQKKPMNGGKENSSDNIKTNLRTVNQKNVHNKSKQHMLEIPNPTECAVIVQKLQPKNIHNSPTEKNDIVKAKIYKGVKSFWDTDAESDLEATPLTEKNTVTSNSEMVSKALPLQSNVPLNKVSKQSNISDSCRNKINESSKIKITGDKKMNLSLKNNQKETKTNIPSKKPISNNSRVIDKIVAESTTVESEVKSKKTSALLKENRPPYKKCKNGKNITKVSNTKPNEKCKESPEKKNEDGRVGRPQTVVNDNMTSNKIEPQMNNNDLSLNNNESQHIKVHNNTLRIRAQRKLKAKKCCGEPETSNLSETNNNITLCRSLRSRLVDLSASLKSDDSNTKFKTKTALKPKKPKVKADDACKTSGELTSDVSFTLTTEVLPAVNRTVRNRKTSVTTKEQKQRQSDVSFTLSENKSQNTSVTTRSFKRNREIEALQNNSASLFGKLSPINRTIALKSRAINRSYNTRLNKGRRLI